MRPAMIKWWLAVVALASAVCYGPGVARADNVDFDDLSLAADSYWNGEDLHPWPENNEGEEHPFTSHGVEFYNYHIDGYYTALNWPYTYWEGWAYSNMKDTTTTGYGNQYSAITGGGSAGSDNYGVAYMPETPDVSLDAFRRVGIDLAGTDEQGRRGFSVTNTTYAYLSMRDGDTFTAKFGGESGDVEDWFLLTITGLDASGDPIATVPVEFYLADYRFADNGQDYILHNWTFADVTSLVDGGADELQFVLTSSDAGAYGINTPLFFAVDAVPEPSTIVMLGVGALAVLFWWLRRRTGGG